MLVDYSQDRWRLIEIKDPTTPSLIVEAKKGAPFRYNGHFGRSRDLPENGEILGADLRQVVLGWSETAQAWQLGLTLSPEISLTRASRWFELLRISQAESTLDEEATTQLGQALAQVLALPFIAAATSEEEPEPEPEPAPLADLPLTLGRWRLHIAEAETRAIEKAEPSALRLSRGPGWRRHQQWQLAKYALLAAIYLWVAGATLTSDLGLPNAGTLIGSLTDALGLSAIEGFPPNDRLLPYLGLAVAALLVLALLRRAWLNLRVAHTFLIDPIDQSISAWRGRRQLWKISADALQAVYVSEVIKFGGGRLGPFSRRQRLIVQHGEINLQLRDGNFRPLIIEGEKVLTPLRPAAELQAEKDRALGISPLEPADATTALQAVATHIAHSLGALPLWYDRRDR